MLSSLNFNRFGEQAKRVRHSLGYTVLMETALDKWFPFQGMRARSVTVFSTTCPCSLDSFLLALSLSLSFFSASPLFAPQSQQFLLLYISLSFFVACLPFVYRFRLLFWPCLTGFFDRACYYFLCFFEHARALIN